MKPPVQSPSLSLGRAMSRRTLLRSLGVSMGLPFLEAMQPTRLLAAPARAPQRTAFFYIPNGVIQDSWHPETAGADYVMPPSLKPLESLREQMNVFTGLDREFRGGTGVHAQAACSWLTSSPPQEALDGNFPTNISLDQILARQIGGQTLFPSIELSCNNHTNLKETKYFETVSWKAPGYASSVEKNPRDVFRRLFGKPDPADRSVLDVVLQDANRMRRSLGRTDQEKLDEYLYSVRTVEQRIERAEKAADIQRELPMQEPEGIPENRGEYIRLMGALIVLAFQQDVTRVATLLVDPERWDTPRMYHGLFDRPQNHHVLTHTKGDEAKATLRRIDHYHVEQFAWVVKRMAEIQEGERTMLDNSLMVLGSGMGDGRVHDYNNLPIVTVGNSGGRWTTGQHHRFEGRKPLADLWLTVLKAQGIERERFADSTSVMRELLS